MKYAPSIWDFHNNFFLVDRSKEPYFLVSQKGEVLRSNKVGQRLLKRLSRTKPQLLEALVASLNELIANPTKKVITLLIGEQRKRVLRAVPVAAGAGYMVEIDRV
jgi:hypothetical protein